MYKKHKLQKYNFSRRLDNELAVLQLPIATLKFIFTHRHRKHQKIFLLKYCTIYQQQFYYRVGLCYYYVGSVPAGFNCYIYKNLQMLQFTSSGHCSGR